jgi:hypothetical protein
MIHIEHATINLAPGPMASALLAAFSDYQPSAHSFVDEPPAIGCPWRGGIYAGIAAADADNLDGHLVLLLDKPDGKLNWADANAWAAGLGDGARLPKRFESALLYANVQSHIETGHYYWTGTQYSEGYAWFQLFGGGLQGFDSKSYEARARAVRRFAI